MTTRMIYLGVLELLLDISNGTAATLAHECSAHKLRSHFRRPRHGARDGHELTDTVHSQVANTRGEGEVVESDRKFASGERR